MQCPGLPGEHNTRDDSRRDGTLVWPFQREHGIMNSEKCEMSAQKIDWSACPLVEVNPKVQSGAPVLRGTRLPVSAIVDNFDYGLGVAEISEQFEVPQSQVQAILTYADGHRIAHPA
jgi:uncharacterized protein (DUF433 family)